MKIFTSYHKKAPELIEMGLTPISISVQFPRFSKIKYASYKELGPTYKMLKMSLDDYDKLFQEILGKLDPVKVHTHLTNLSQGKDIVLLCLEKDLNDCHRRMVAEWLEKKLQIKVEEITFKQEKKKKPQKSSDQLNIF